MPRTNFNAEELKTIANNEYERANNTAEWAADVVKDRQMMRALDEETRRRLEYLARD